MTGPPAVRRRVLLGAVGAVGAAALLLPPGGGITGLAIVFTVAWAVCVALLVGTGQGGLYRPGAGYVVVFGLFHGGLLVDVALRGPAHLKLDETVWLFTGNVPAAVRLVIIGMATFALAVELSAARARRAATEVRGMTPHLSGIFAVAGLGLELLGLVIFASALAKAGGVDVFLGGYLTFLEANESGGLLGYGTLFIGVGAVLALIAGGPARTAAWAGFAGYAVAAFLLGTRGAVLFLLLTLLIVEVRRGRRIRPAVTALGVPCLLLLIGLVQRTRVATAGQGGPIWSAPLDAITEFGYSLRPAVLVLDWHGAGEPFRHGATLVAVPMRFVEATTGWHGGPPAVDDRLFNVEILHRVGAIGGSPIAEAYHNAGLAGVVVFMAVLGVVLGRFDRRHGDPFGDAMVGVVMLPLLIQVRNSFAPVPAQLAIGLLVLWLLRVVAVDLPARRGRQGRLRPQPRGAGTLAHR